MRIDPRLRSAAPLTLVLAASGFATVLPVRVLAQPSVAAPPVSRPAGKPAAAPQPLMEARALDLLRASSARLAASRSMAFTATVGYEYPSRLGPPLLYTVRYEVLMQRPDRLRVLIPGDGPASQFFFDGRTIMAFAPERNLVAIEPAPPTIDEALQSAFQRSALYFPFTDLLVSDPYRALTDGVFHAFRIGPSAVIGGVPTEMVAIANKDVFLQIWISVNDKLPRRIRAVYAADRQRLRHQMDLSDWKLDPAIPAGAFDSPQARAARRMPFQNPGVPAPAGARSNPSPTGRP